MSAVCLLRAPAPGKTRFIRFSTRVAAYVSAPARHRVGPPAPCVERVYVLSTKRHKRFFRAPFTKF
eukprot:8920419-Lingulodinium_polyedra.AAC.1